MRRPPGWSRRRRGAVGWGSAAVALTLVMGAIPTIPRAGRADAAAAGAAPAGELVSCRVFGVHDGDTLRAIDGSNRERRVRLHGIDAPELGQPFGRVARDRWPLLPRLSRGPVRR